MNNKFYTKIENIVAVLVCIASPSLFGLLWYFGLMPLDDVYLAILITVGSTVFNVTFTWIAVRLLTRKKHRGRKKHKKYILF